MMLSTVDPRNVTRIGSPDSTLTVDQKEAFFSDTVRWLRGNEKFSIVKWAYTNLANWTAVAEAHEDPEVKLFQKLIADGVIPKSDELVHLGVGDEKAWTSKAKHVLDASGARLNIGVDFSAEALGSFEQTFDQNVKGVTRKSSEIDFLKAFTVPMRLDNPLFFCDGVTMGNAPALTSNESLDFSMQRTFRNVLNAMQHRGNFLFTLHTDDTGGGNGAEHVARYNNEANRTFTLSIIDIMKHELGMVGVDKDEASYMPMWDRQGAVNHGLIVNNSNGSSSRDLIFPGRVGVGVQFEEAKLYFTNRSIVPITQRVLDNLTEAGFYSPKAYRITNGTVHPRVAFLASASPSP